jgi:glycine cleavage system H protein
MVALLVLATFAVFITLDVLLNREKYKFRVAEAPVRERVRAPVVSGVALPESLSYHPGHTWAIEQGNGRIRIGLDELAASLLGKLERVEVPSRGRWVSQGERGWTVHTDRGGVSMLAPADGEVVGVNDKALAEPELVSRDPYGEGWLLEIFSRDAQASFRNLLSGNLARRWMEESMAELRRLLSPHALATALDGGRIAPEMGRELPPEKWLELTRQFFRT